jgi:hypothetical protein
MTQRVYNWVKLFLENKWVTVVLLTALFPSLAGNIYKSAPPSVKPAKVAEKSPETVIEEITKPAPVMTEIVIPTYKPHTHPEIIKEIDDKIKKALSDHERGSLH